MLRWMSEVTKLDRIRNERIRAGSSQLFGTWAKMLSAIFNRAKSCKHGKHCILYNVYIHEHLFYFVDTCVARLENTP